MDSKLLLLLLILPFVLAEPIDLEELKELVDNNAAEMQRIENEIEDQSETIVEQKEIIDDQEQRIEQLEAKSSMVRMVPTCEHLKMYGIDQSGEYDIDPDGELFGEDPIKAYCDFSGDGPATTEIRHNSDKRVDLTKCSESGCFEHKVEYLSDTVVAQMKALADISNSCSQEFIFNCYLVPLEYNGNKFGWWVDRFGNNQYFFHGNGVEVNETHLCKCGMEGNCINENLLCNCDSKTPTWLNDTGLITSKNLLPITSFNYGPLKYDIEEANVQIGKLKCSGLADSLFGFMHPQLASGGGSGPVSRPSISSGGGARVAFSAQKNSGNNFDGTITYNSAPINIGNGMNTSSGEFTAPQAGNYQFSFSAVTATSSGYVGVNVLKNGNELLIIHDGNDNGDQNNFSYSWMTFMNSGDKIKLSVGAHKLYADENDIVQFNGFLL